jgi:hypothetical protein
VSDLVLLTKPGCHLCQQMKAAIAPVLEELGLRLSERDVRGDPQERARWEPHIPVLLRDGVELARHRTTPAALRARLAAARG